MALEGESLCFGLYAYEPIEITEKLIDFDSVILIFETA